MKSSNGDDDDDDYYYSLWTFQQEENITKQLWLQWPTLAVLRLLLHLKGMFVSHSFISVLGKVYFKMLN